MKKIIAVTGMLVAGMAMAATVTIAPGNGVETNVTTRFTGATDIVVNSGTTGGGIVALANPYNTYTGSTTLNSGTLVATVLGGDFGSNLGLTSGLTLGAGTFRYSGADGASMPIPVASAFTSASTKSCVLDVQSDLVVTTNWTQHYGTFIKTGPGTVTFRGNNNFFGAVDSSTLTATLNGNSAKLAFNANGDGPTAGVRGGFVLAEGKMVIEGDDATTNYINSSTTYGAIGTWTAADGEQEKSAVLEIRGGYNIMPRACWLAYHNGTAATGGENVSSGLRVTGGYLRIGMPDVPVSGNETIFVGGQTSPNGPQRSNPFIEVTGGTLNVGKNLQLGNQGGVNTRVSVSGDGRLIIGQNVGNVYSATTTTSTNSVTVSENGVLEAQCIQMLNNSVGSQCDVRLLDNALYAWTVTNKPAFNKESSNKGVMNVLIDGGTVSNSFKATKAHEVAIFHANTDRVAIGTRGATFVNGADSTAQYIFGLRVPFVATNTVEGMERQPVNLLAANEVGQKKTTYRFYSAFNWPYSVRLGPFAYIYVQSGAKFATDGKFIHCRAARLISNVDVLTFKDYQIGEVGDTVDDAATVFLSAGTHIVVTNSFRKASETTRLHVYMAKAGTGWTSGGSEFTTPGDYTVLVVPESSRSDLEQLASTATYAHANKCRSGFHVVDNGDGTLALKLCILSSASGATTTVTDFVDGAELGLGTLEYAGAGEETTGFTLNALGAAVLKTSAPLTVTEGVDTAVGALIKTGAADLRLEGSGSYSFAGAGVEWSATAADNEIGANGESPVAGYKGLSVREGRVVVGRQPDDAPTVTVSALSVGSNPAETDIPAELIVSNGIVKVYGEVCLSPALGKQNRIELSGGTLSVDSTFRPGNMPGMDVAGATPGLLVVNDGGHLVLNGTGGLYNGDMGEMELILNEGGVVSAYSNFQGTKESVPYRGTLRFNGGVYSYAVPDLAPYLRYVNVFVGAKGAVFDGEERFANGGIPTANYLHIAGTWAKDPSLGGEPDGGITFRGRAFFYFGGAFTSSIEGPVVVQDQAQLMSIRSAASGMSVSVKPGCGIRSYQNSANYVSMFKDLALGEAGTPGHVRLEIRGLSDARSIYSIVVSNEFATLSPVCFSGRSTYGDLVPSFTTGTYTALVYRAESDANVDLAKFYLDPELSNRTATFSKADISGGAYAGWKAIVVNVAEGSGAAAPVDTSGYARWTATAAGGGWSSPGNWENGVLPDASHLAVFGAPGAAGVAVNLDVEPLLEKLYIEGSDAGKGYAFGGSRPLGFDGGAFGSALLEIAGGSHAFTAPLKIDRLLTMNAAAGSTVEIAATTGGGTLKLNASGDTKTGKVVVREVGGALAAGFGRTEVEDISFARESGKLMLGSGTLAYTGASPADDVHLALAPNLANANTAVVFENAADVRVTEVTGGASCALIKTGAGDLSIGGTLSAEFKGTVARANASSDLIADSGNAPTTGFRGLNAAEGTIAIGAVGDAANAPSVKSDNISIGLVCSPVSLGAPVELVMNNGTLAITSHLLLGNFMTWQSGVADVRYVQNGGKANAANAYIGYAGSGDTPQAVNGAIVLNDGEFNISNTLYPSHGRRLFAEQNGNSVTINGGVMNVKNVVGVSYVSERGNAAPSTVSVNGGEFNVSGNYRFVSRKDEWHTFALNGGVFRLGGYMKATNSVVTGVTADFKFNGGEFRPLSSAPSIDDAIDVLVGEGGAAISTEETSGGVCTLAMSFKHDPSLAGVDGGLAKRGKGTLVLSAGNTYTGPTIVEEGVLQIAGDAVAPGLVRVDYGAALDLGGGRTLGSLTGDGIVCNGPLTLAGALTPQFGIPTVDGDFATTSTASVDFGCTGDDMVAYGSKHLVLRVTGTVDANASFKAINCGQPCRLTTSVEDGLVYVLVKSGGTVLIIR